jgi:chromosome segregation ATPase
MTKKYPKVRVQDVDYETLKKLSERLGISMSETIRYLLTKDKTAIPSISRYKFELEKELRANIREEMKKEYEIQIANLKGKIEVLEKEKQELIQTQQYDIYMLDELQKDNASLKEELEKYKNLNYDNVVRDYEKLLEEKKALETEIKALKEEIEKYRNLDVNSVIAERDKLANERDTWKNKAEELESQIEDERAFHNEIIKEFKFMKDEVCKELRKIGEVEPAIKGLIDKLINDIVVKVYYELSKLE